MNTGDAVLSTHPIDALIVMGETKRNRFSAWLKRGDNLTILNFSLLKMTIL
jgi:hypothetical protein